MSKFVKNNKVYLHGDGGECTKGDKEGEEDGAGIRQDLQHHTAWVHLLITSQSGNLNLNVEEWEPTLTGKCGEPSFSSF